MIKPTELKKLLKLAREFNLRTLKVGDVFVEFSEPPHVTQKAFEPVVIVQSEKDLESQMPSDDEMLHFSTPYFDVLQSQRKEN